MRISRRRVSPEPDTINRRVELLPQSRAATGSVTNVLHYQRWQPDRVGDECAHGILGADQKVRQVRVQTLHSDARATHSPSRLDEVRSHRRCLATRPILLVRSSQLLGVDEVLKTVHAAVTLETTDRVV